MSRSYRGIQGIGKSVIAKTNGCDWCLSGRCPPYTTETLNIELGGRKLIRYIGQGICEACVLRMKRELQSTYWRKERTVFFDKKQFCSDCEMRGILAPATILDHIEPWRYRPDLFWYVANWQGLCFPCHDVKSRLERT